MAKLSPEALQKIADALPETYETNPDQFVSDWEAAQAARRDVDRLQEVNRWYEESYKPWWQTYGGDFTEFQQWKQRGGETDSPAAEVATPAREAGGVDWNDLDAPRRGYETLESRLNGLEQKMDSGFTLVGTTIQSRTEEMQRLLALQEQAYGILNEATWNRIEPGWRPPVDIPQVVRHAQQYNIPDLRRAYDHYTQSDREKDLERRAFERGKEEGQRAAAAQAVTTEMGGGTPFHHRREPEQRRGYGIGHDEIIAAAQSRQVRRAS
jgi:hypothetical protein